jgi:hypothetical protein
VKRFKDVLIALLKFKAKHETYGWLRSAVLSPAAVFLLVGAVQAQIHRPPTQTINPPQELQRTAITSFDALVLDIGGNALDFSGSTRTTLATGEMQNFRWTKQQTDDAFLVLDTTSARAAGFEVRDKGGHAVDGLTFLRGGLRVRRPDGTEIIVVDGWQMLRVFDSTQDGRINSSDPAWQHLRLFTDANANGAIDSGEIKSITDSNVRDLVFTDVSSSRTDQSGNTLSDSSFIRVDGSRGVISNVTFGRITARTVVRPRQ